MVKYKQVVYYRNRIRDWQLDLSENYDINRIKSIVNNCREIINSCKKNNYQNLINELSEGSVKRYEVELFNEKLEYYLNRLKILKLKIGYHIVDINCQNKDIKVLRKDFRTIYNHIVDKKKISKMYVLIHPKYKYIFDGVISDLRPINNFKQANYINSYIEILWITEELNNIWKANKDKLKLQDIVFESKTAIEQVQYQCQQLNKILQMYLEYNLIKKLLKKSTCFHNMNPYKENTYVELYQVVFYLSLLNEYLEQKTYEQNKRILKKQAVSI